MKTIRVFITVYIHEECAHRPGGYRRKKAKGDKSESEKAVER